MLINTNYLPEYEDSQVDLSPVVSAIENLGKKIDKIELPEPAEAVEEVSVSNLDEIKLHLRNELSKAIKPILSKLEAIKIPEPPKYPTEIRVSNLEPQIAPLDSVRVNNLDELKESILGLYNAILGINISVPPASINLPAPVVNVAPSQVDLDVSRLLQALEPLKYISDRPTKPIAVRMSDGQRFLKAMQELKKSNDNLGVVYAGHSGMDVDEYKQANSDFKKTLKQAVKWTTSGTTTYFGFAPVGSSQASAVWQAMKLDESSGGVLTYADGNSNFDNVATDLTALSYS